MEKKKIKLNARTKKTLWCYLILSTQIIGLLVFTLYPTLWAWAKAFFFDVQIPSKLKFVGWDNFIAIFTTDKSYWKSWITTLIFAVGKLPIELPLAMLVAICLTRKEVKGKGFFRAVFYLPNIVSVAIVGLMLSSMFDYFGFINTWFVRLGILEKPVEWFSETNLSMTMLIIASVWSTFGTNVLYFIAALSNVSEDILESAKLDGASPWTTFWRIKLPMMAPVLQTILLLALNGTLHTGDFVLATTNGAPFGTTHTVMSYQASKFVPGFTGSVEVNIGYGSAICVVSSVLMICIALIYSKLSKRLQNMY